MMDDQLPTTNQPPEIPQAVAGNPYVAPSQPPMLPQKQLGSDTTELTQDEKTMAMLVHLLSLLTGFLGVIILWSVKKNDSKFVDFHGREAMNFMISMTLYSMVLVAISFVLAIVTMGFGMILVVPLVMILGIAALIFEIMSCIKANQGEWHRYPLCIRFIPDPR